MQKAFYASLCYQGARGGAIYINDDSVIYKNQTLTIPDEYKKIIMPLKDIEKIEKGFAFVFPTVTIYLKGQQRYKFIVFNRRRFVNTILPFIR